VANDLIKLSAVEAVAKLRTKEISPLEMIEAAASRTAECEPALNALSIQCFDRARERAVQLEAQPDQAHPAWLAGLPIAIKDLIDVAGLRTTYGCPLKADNIAQHSDILVQTLEARGALVVAKSNTPEYGMLPVTTNRVFGTTVTPWDITKTSGGSSGGAAAAVASGEVWLAHGSDIGGSLRIPASFCGVTGYRPTPGRVPRNFSKRGFSPLSVQGPMARTVADCALFLDAQSAFYHHDPLSLPEIPGRYSHAVANARPPKRVAFTLSFGLGPVHPQVEKVARQAAAQFEAMGAEVVEAHPDLGPIRRTFQTLIGLNLLIERKDFIAEHADELEPMHKAVVDFAMGLSAEAVAEAERQRALMFTRFAAFFDEFDVILSPTLSVPPFSKHDRGDDADGWATKAPSEWFQQCWGTVLTASPITALPGGFTDDGLPVGVQILAPARRDDMALSAAAMLERALALPIRLPVDPRG
jgi:amidase